MNRKLLLLILLPLGISFAQMTNININGTQGTTTVTPSVVVLPATTTVNDVTSRVADIASSVEDIVRSIPVNQSYVVVRPTANAGMTNINLNGVQLKDVRAPQAPIAQTQVAQTRVIPHSQPRVIITPTQGRMTNININAGGHQTVLESIPAARAVVVVRRPASARTEITTTRRVTTTAPVASLTPQAPSTAVLPSAPAPSTPTVAPTPAPTVVSTPSVPPLTPPQPVATLPTPTFGVQPAPPVIQPQSINVEPVRQIYGESRWFGTSLPTRNFSNAGIGVRYGVIDLFAPLIDGRFDFDYYPVGNALEFSANAQFLLISTSSTTNSQLYFDFFGGLGPRLYIDSDSTALAFGGYIETELRYGKIAPFVALDASVPIYTFQATTNDNPVVPFLFGLEVGVNFYF